ncbi:MAG: hypothetical protein Q9208_004931 [Pyrenodesmia sp. 3 TL-2023]
MAEESNDLENLRLRKKNTGTIQVQGADGQTRTVNLEDLADADSELATRFGYKPVFKREFGFLSTFSFAVSISGLFSTVVTTFSYPLFTGWLNLLGQIAGVASSEYGAAALLLAVVSIGTDFKYRPTTGDIVAVMAGLSVVTGVVNSVSTYWMAKMTGAYVIFHILVLVVCSIALLAMCDNRHDPRYVFTDVVSTSGWAPVGFSWLFGFLSVSWTMTDYDATAHITEEISNPEVEAPQAIWLAMLFTYLAGFLFNIVLCFVMGDMAQILSSPTAQPVAQIFYNVLGRVRGIIFTFCAFLIIKFVTFTALVSDPLLQCYRLLQLTSELQQSLARTLFAFSRDRLVPFSNIWIKINRKTQTPLYAVWISVVCVIAINLIGLGSYTTIAGVFNATAIALDWSYCIPILCKMASGQFEPGPWNLGKFSFAVNAWALLWTTFVTIIFVLPTFRPVTADTMNYASVFLVGVVAFSTIFWWLAGRKFYTGPLIEADVTKNDSEDVEDGSRSESDLTREAQRPAEITA